MKCSKCEFENPEGLKFCVECGNKLEILCPNCGFGNAPSFKFCGECGHDLRKPKEAYTIDNSVPDAPTPEIPVREIPATSSPIQSERKHVTALFSDISGYTSMSEKLDPEEVKEITSRLFAEVSRIVGQYDGFIEKFIGDAIMATFGAPYSHGNDAEKAVLAALKMRGELERLRSRKEEKHQFDVRIGINSGNVVAGYIGSMKRLQYTVLGNVVNVASYLESIAKPNEILIGEETFRQVKKLFLLEESGKKRVKRGMREVRYYRVIGEK